MKQTICLCMIVKNEIAVLKKALDSVVSTLDYWVIGDTGSDDGTQEFIQQYFEDKGIPGELYEDEWVNFAHNRELVFVRAKGKADYLLTLDADEEIVPFKGKEPLTKKKFRRFPTFKKDLIRAYTHLSPWVYKRAQLFRGDLDWKWAEGLHEYPYCESPTTEEFIPSFGVYTVGGGARHEGQTSILNDIAVLEEALEDTPSSRNYYNLGMTQQSRHAYGEAITAYAKAIELSNWDEEIYLAHLSMGLCQHYSSRRLDAIQSFGKATEVIPHRAEAFYYLAEQFFHEGDFSVARILLEKASSMKFPASELSLVDTDVYNWKIPDVLSLCLYENAEYETAYKIIRKALNSPKTDRLDPANRRRLEENFALFKRMMKVPKKHRLTSKQRREKDARL
jgi:glycosyltransferase involved in cell wall biosynthesis